MTVKYDRNMLIQSADLFGELQNGNTPQGFNSLFNIPEVKKEESENYIDINLLIPYSEHYFKLPEGEEWESFVASIKEHGVLVPILVREISDGKYQILAGHCRTQAAKEAGIDKIPARIIDADDVAASVIVGVTNKQREYISPLEWGRTYRRTYELMKQQGGRTDLTSSHGETKLRSDEVVAEMYGESRATVQRRIRLTYLIEPLADLFEAGRLTQAIAVDVSYLTEPEQVYLFNILDSGEVAITPDTAAVLKSMSGHMSNEDILLILSEVKKNQPKPLTKKYAVPETYFPMNITAKKRNDYIIAALKYIRENEIEITL